MDSSTPSSTSITFNDPLRAHHRTSGHTPSSDSISSCSSSGSRRSSLNVAARPFIPQVPPPVVDGPHSVTASPLLVPGVRRSSFSVPEDMPLAAWAAQQEKLGAIPEAATRPRENQTVEWDFGGWDGTFDSSQGGSHFNLEVALPLVHPPAIHSSIALTPQDSNMIYYDGTGFGFPSPLSTPGVGRFPTTPSPKMVSARFASVDYGRIMAEEGISPYGSVRGRSRSSSLFERPPMALDDPEVDHLSDLNRITDVRLLSGSLWEASFRRQSSGTVEGSPVLIYQTPPTASQSLFPNSPETVVESPLSTPPQCSTGLHGHMLHRGYFPTGGETTTAPCVPPGLVHPLGHLFEADGM